LVALLVWSAAGLAALVASLRIVARELEVSWTWAGAAGSAAGVIIFSATGVVVVTGQLTFLLLFPLTLAWAAARRDRWTRAAMWLGIATSVKVFLAIFLVHLIVTRRWRAAITMIGTAVICMAAGAIVFGLQAYTEWRHTLSAIDWAWSPMNASIAGLISRSFAESPYFTPLSHAPAVVPIVTALIAVPIGLITVFTTARDTTTLSVDRAFAALLLAAQLISPLGWVYYLWLVVGPMAALAKGWILHPSLWRDRFLILAIAGLVLPITWTLIWRSYPWGSVTLGSIYTWTALALWLAVMRDWYVRDSVRKAPV